MTNDYIVEGLLVAKGDPTVGRVDDLLRICTHALVEGGIDLLLLERHALAFLKGEGSLRFLRLRHKTYSSANGYASSWVSLSGARSDARDRAILGVGVHLGHVGDQVDIEWEAGLEIMRTLTAATPFELAFLNGRPIDVERPVLPKETSYASSGVPALVTPWTYIGSERLQDPARSSPTELNAHAATPWAGGYALQAVEHLHDSPSREFLDALSADWSSSYLAPLR